MATDSNLPGQFHFARPVSFYSGETMTRYLDWLRQAENDPQWARHSLAGGFYAQTCFVSQQACEALGSAGTIRAMIAERISSRE